jgi:hypothetical protein
MAELEGSVHSDRSGQSHTGAEEADQWTRLKEADNAEQLATVIYPANEDRPLQVTRAHAELHESQGQVGI